MYLKLWGYKFFNKLDCGHSKIMMQMHLSDVNKKYKQSSFETFLQATVETFPSWMQQIRLSTDFLDSIWTPKRQFIKPCSYLSLLIIIFCAFCISHKHPKDLQGRTIKFLGPHLLALNITRLNQWFGLCHVTNGGRWWPGPKHATCGSRKLESKEYNWISLL